MKRRILTTMLFLLTALLFSGCAMRTVEQMYALPKRSDEFNEMQSAIDTAMYGMTYASPQSGENQQTVQMADDCIRTIQDENQSAKVTTDEDLLARRERMKQRKGIKA
mgnify:CR=1 FL=1